MNSSDPSSRKSITTVFIEDTATGSDEVACGSSLAVQNRNWLQRWEEIQADLDRIHALHTELRCDNSIKKASSHLHDFFIRAYHLKDLLIQDASTTNVLGTTIEKAINDEPVFSLLADLANLEKHGALNKPPRSGEIPRIGRISGMDEFPDRSGHRPSWRFSMEIHHKNQTHDALTIASSAVVAWRAHLKQWGLIS